MTELVLRNEGTLPVQAFQDKCYYFFCNCGPVGICILGQAIKPNGALPEFYLQPDVFLPNLGAFVYAQKSLASNLRGNLRIRDLSRQASSAGTEIPIVRKKDFRTSILHLENVPVDSVSRLRLRVYGVSSPSGRGDILVRLYDLHGRAPLAERALTLHPPDIRTSLPTATDFPDHPAYAELAGIEEFQELRGKTRLRIEVIPLTPGLVFWSFLTVTNNDSQQVTTVTPQ